MRSPLSVANPFGPGVTNQGAAAHNGIDQLQRFVQGAEQLRVLATSGPRANIDEHQLFQLLVTAQRNVQEWQSAHQTSTRPESTHQLSSAMLNFSSAWLRLAASGYRMRNDEDGLRGSKAADAVCSLVDGLLAPEFDTSQALMKSFSESGGLGLLGSSLCHFNESDLPLATKKLKRVALRCGAYANNDPNGHQMLAANVEAFRTGFVTRLVEDLSRAPGRHLRVSHFKDLVVDIGEILSIVYSEKQVFAMSCFISLNLSGRLSAFCPGVGGEDAAMALDWLTSEIQRLLQHAQLSSSHTSASGQDEFGSLEAIREQVRESMAANGLWSGLLLHAGSSTIEHAQHLLKTLLDSSIYSLSELVQAFQQAGAFPPSHITVTSRLALQQALLTAAAAQGVKAVTELFDNLSRVLEFDHLDQEGIDLLVRVTQQALSAGYRPGVEQARSLAFTHLLRYLQWGYGQSEIPKRQIDFAHRSLLQSLAPHPALVLLLPSLAIEALSLGATSASAREGRPHDVLRCVSALGNVAVDAARTGVAAAFGSREAAAHLAADAVARLCALLWQCTTDLHVLSAPAADVWLGAFVDTFCCYLRSPGAKLDSSQTNVLWTRLVVQPVFGLSVLCTASHYFKLAFLVPSMPRESLLAPFKEMPRRSPEIELVHATIFCPASFGSYGEEPPPLTAGFFFPLMSEARSSGGFVQMVVASEHASPEKASPPQTSQNTSNVPGSIEIDFDAVAASAGISVPATSASTPALRLQQVQEVLSANGSPELLMNLRGYEAIERYLWDEFATQGQIKSTSKFKERDLLAERCRQLLKQQFDASGGHPSPPVAEALSKFTHLCDNIKAQGLVHRTTRALHTLEEALAEAEDALIEEQGAHARALARLRRKGETVPKDSGPVENAKKKFEKIQLELVVELRLLAARAQLGLVELLGISGLARALRAIGPTSCDPLYERLLTSDAWLQAQSRDEVSLPVIQSPEQHKDSHLKSKEEDTRDVVTEDPSLVRPEGLAGYTDLRPLSRGGHVCTARRHGVVVVLKALRGKSDTAVQRELRALSDLRQSCIVSLQGILQEAGNPSHIELSWCGGGNLYEWCGKYPDIVHGLDAEAYIKGLGIFREVWHAVAYVHSKGAAHGDLALHHIVLTCDHRPVLSDFSRCCLLGDNVSSWSSDASRPSDGYEAPEAAELTAAGARTVPTQEADNFAAGVMTMKAFLGLDLDVSAYPVDPRTGLRNLPEKNTDADLLDLVQAVVAQSSKLRMSSAVAARHRALDPAFFLRRQGLLGVRKEGLAAAAEQLRQEHRGRRVDETLMFNRDSVFDAVASSKIFEWSEEALLGEWRVTLDSETGVDAGGLRREVITLFFEQLQESRLVDRVGADTPGIQPTLFIADRLKSDRSPQQWRQSWSAIGAMTLRSIVHFGGAPVLFSSAVFDCAFGRIEKLPPDEGVNDDEVDGGVQALARLRDARGDDWARSRLLDFLQRLRHADAQKSISYRWMLAQRIATDGEGTSSPNSMACVFLISSENLETLSVMLGSLAYKFLIHNSLSEKDGSISHAGAVLEWALLWDVYLKYIGDGDRWTAYEAFAMGLSARGRRLELWTHLTGQRIADSLEGAKLTPPTVLANLEYKPGYGYDTQIGFFKNVLSNFTSAELSMFLRFATGIGRLPASGKFPNGQKLTVRFLPDQQERLPTAHTCFWTIDVPPYEDELDLETKLRQAIAAPQPFTFS